jgi:hypothetical protein
MLSTESELKKRFQIMVKAKKRTIPSRRYFVINRAVSRMHRCIFLEIPRLGGEFTGGMAFDIDGMKIKLFRFFMATGMLYTQPA